jgi:hypothetical protein
MKPIKVTVNRPKNVSKALAYARAEAKKAGVSFNGDDEHGHGQGRGFKASYTVHARCIELTILDKPFWIPAGMVQDAVRKYCAEYLRKEEAA